MDFSWTEEQETAYAEARAFALAELNANLTQREAVAGLPAELWRRCARFGLLGLVVPEAWGGLEMSVATAVRTFEGVGEGCQDNGLLMALGAQLWSVIQPILQFGTPAQKSVWLPGLANGELVAAFALTEPQGGSDAFHLTTHAVPEEGAFRLAGAKSFITNAPDAGLFLVLATTQPGAGWFGLTAFLVPRASAGVSVGPALHKMGLETAPMADLYLDEVRLGPEAVLGEVSGGGAVLRSTLEWERGCLLAPALGTMTRLLAATVSYCRERKQFGRPIIEFEAVAARLAEMKMRRDLSRLLTYRFAWLKDQGRAAGVEASQVKLYVSESLRRIAEHAVHLHGGNGYMKEFEYERAWRDAMASSIYSGTTEMQINVIADSLLQGGLTATSPTTGRLARSGGEGSAAGGSGGG